MQMAYTRFACLIAAVLAVAACSGFRGVDLSIPQDLLTADTEESLLSSMSLLDGCSLAGTWKYESEKDPEIWGYMIIEVVLNRVRGAIEHHVPRWFGDSRWLFVFRGIINPDGLSATASTVGYAVGYPRRRSTRPTNMGLTLKDDGLIMKATRLKPDASGPWESNYEAKKIQSGQCQKSVLYVARIEDWVLGTSYSRDSDWDVILLERNRQRELCLAAHQGDAEAQYTLGNNYKSGQSGTAPDAARAYLWYSLAGDFRNAIQLKETVASAMTASQMDEAERLVANWRPKPHKCEFEPLQSYY